MERILIFIGTSGSIYTYTADGQQSAIEPLELLFEISAPRLGDIDLSVYQQPKQVFARPRDDRLQAIALPVPKVNRRLSRIRGQHNW